MALIVQKYGGSSVATPEHIRAVAERVIARQAAGHRLVVVVSAMGDTTDKLLALAEQLHPAASGREVDLLLSTGEVVSCALLALALQARGVPARALTGAQAGIITDGNYSRAASAGIVPDRVRAALDAGEVPVVAGFQGISAPQHYAEVTTLGRGGSDTTAVALAIGLGAAWCEIYTDVDGVFTADPRLVPAARLLARIHPPEMMELAQQGARVMHPRSVELGGIYGMPIMVASSYHERPGTWIVENGRPLPDRAAAPGVEGAMELRNKISGIAHDTDVAKITVLGLPQPEYALCYLFEPLAEAVVNVDAIARAIHHDRAVAKVSVIGVGVGVTPGLAARAFTTLGRAGIRIDMVTTSEVRISCLVPEERIAEAARLLHEAFGLQNEERATSYELLATSEE